MKKIFKNKIFLRVLQLSVSSVLLVYLFRKNNILNIVNQLVNAPFWYILVATFFWLCSNFVVCWRWSYLVLDKTSLKDVLFFMKSVLKANFYAIFLPSSVSTDLIKWLPMIKKYPQLSKAQLAGSVMLDRIVGLTVFVIVAFVSVVVGKITGIDFPVSVFWLFLVAFVGIVVFYLVAFFVNVEKIFEVIRLPSKIKRIFLVVFKADKEKMIKALVLSFVVTPLWSVSGWLGLYAFKTGVSLLETMILIPVINLLLILPISVAGFGPREGLFAYFFGPTAVSTEAVLAASAFTGIMNFVFALLGGLIIFV